jgi:hypothetical protein
MMLINLGVGLISGAKTKNAMDVDGAEEGEGEEAEEEEGDDPWYSDKVAMSSVVEDMSERLSDEDVVTVLETLSEILGRRN